MIHRYRRLNPILDSRSVNGTSRRIKSMHISRFLPLLQKECVQEFGTTYEHRPMMLLTVTSPDNLGNLESIRTQHLRLSDPVASGTMKTEEMRVVVWMGYSVHGNEPSGRNE